jgi:uncharacterized RDD family membrane protein YckC
MKSCLVLMPFSEELTPRFEFLVQCGKDLNLEVRRVDTYAYSGNILTAISKAISKADIVIADLSKGNANVLYELAIAQCLGQRVVLITDDRNTVPFDLLAYRIELLAEPYTDQKANVVRALRQALTATYVTGPLGGNVIFGQRVFFRRTTAFLVDLIFMAIAAALIFLILRTVRLTPEVGSENWNTLALALGELIPLMYFTVTVWKLGATLGQRVLDLKVVTYDGDVPTFMRSLGRTISSVLSVFTYGIGFLWCLRGPGFRTFHDIASGTMVIRRIGRPRLSPI